MGSIKAPPSPRPFRLEKRPNLSRDKALLYCLCIIYTFLLVYLLLLSPGVLLIALLFIQSTICLLVFYSHINGISSLYSCNLIVQNFIHVYQLQKSYVRYVLPQSQYIYLAVQTYRPRYNVQVGFMKGSMKGGRGEKRYKGRGIKEM